MKIQRIAATAILFILGAFNVAHADLLPANGAEPAAKFAEVSILEDRVRIALEIDLADLPIFTSHAAPGTDPAEGCPNGLVAR